MCPSTYCTGWYEFPSRFCNIPRYKQFNTEMGNGRAGVGLLQGVYGSTKTRSCATTLGPVVCHHPGGCWRLCEDSSSGAEGERGWHRGHGWQQQRRGLRAAAAAEHNPQPVCRCLAAGRATGSALLCSAPRATEPRGQGAALPAGKLARARCVRVSRAALPSRPELEKALLPSRSLPFSRLSRSSPRPSHVF